MSGGRESGKRPLFLCFSRGGSGGLTPWRLVSRHVQQIGSGCNGNETRWKEGSVSHHMGQFLCDLRFWVFAVPREYLMGCMIAVQYIEFRFFSDLYRVLFW